MMKILENQVSWCNTEPEIKQLLLLASENWQNTSVAEKYIRVALSKADDNLDVLIGAYRFFFYKHQPVVALSIAKQVLDNLTVTENLPTEWLQLKPILITRQQETNIRLYLNAYAAQSLILAQLGRIEEAKIISQRVREIDDSREFCATTVLEVISKSPDDED